VEEKYRSDDRERLDGDYRLGCSLSRGRFIPYKKNTVLERPRYFTACPERKEGGKCECCIANFTEKSEATLFAPGFALKRKIISELRSPTFFFHLETEVNVNFLCITAISTIHLQQVDY